MPTKQELKSVSISEKCFEGLRTIANWCARHPHITPTQYSRQHHIEGSIRFTGPMIAGAILSKWVKDGLLFKTELRRWPDKPDFVSYGYALTELGVYRLFFLEGQYYAVVIQNKSARDHAGSVPSSNSFDESPELSSLYL